jgi:hypothetical protein
MVRASDARPRGKRKNRAIFVVGWAREVERGRGNLWQRMGEVGVRNRARTETCVYEKTVQYFACHCGGRPRDRTVGCGSSIFSGFARAIGAVFFILAFITKMIEKAEAEDPKPRAH